MFGVLRKQNLMFIFAAQTASPTTLVGRGSSEPTQPVGRAGRDVDRQPRRNALAETYIRKRLSALILDGLKFSQNFLSKSRVEQR